MFCLEVVSHMLIVSVPYFSRSAQIFAARKVFRHMNFNIIIKWFFELSNILKIEGAVYVFQQLLLHKTY